MQGPPLFRGEEPGAEVCRARAAESRRPHQSPGWEAFASAGDGQVRVGCRSMVVAFTSSIAERRTPSDEAPLQARMRGWRTPTLVSRRPAPRLLVGAGTHSMRTMKKGALCDSCQI